MAKTSDIIEVNHAVKNNGDFSDLDKTDFVQDSSKIESDSLPEETTKFVEGEKENASELLLNSLQVNL